MRLLRYISVAIHIKREIKTQKRFNNNFLTPYLNELEARHGGIFKPEQKEKILNYYGLFITAFLCSSYKRLYGGSLNDNERKSATLFGILTPVGDDLFDIDKLDIESIRHITYDPDTYNATTFSSKVAKEIQAYQLSHVPNKKEYLVASKNVLEIQIETIKQTNKNITAEDLEHITYTKGAVSVIIYHQALDEPATKEMLDVLFFVGSLYQLGNDLFDLHKDVRDNIYTLINTCTDFIAFKANFIARIKLQNQKIMALPFPEKNKKEFCITINAINARSLVAIDQFIRLQQKTNNIIDWRKRDRKDMICDMEKPANILKWVYYLLKTPGM